jgi:hypothetical protein
VVGLHNARVLLRSRNLLTTSSLNALANRKLELPLLAGEGGVRFPRKKSRLEPLNRFDRSTFQPTGDDSPSPGGDLSRLGNGERNLSRQSGTKVALRPSERARASQRRDEGELNNSRVREALNKRFMGRENRSTTILIPTRRVGSFRALPENSPLRF